MRKILDKLRQKFQRGGQHGEQAVLAELIASRYPNKNRYLVDVGAYDGKTISNSAWLLEEGWAGILLEPLPRVFSELKKNYSKNSKVKCVQKACSNSKGVQSMYFGLDGSYGSMSTLCTDDNKWFRTFRRKKSIPVQVDTLTNILKENQAPSDPCLLLVDAEGMDYEVLEGLDFSTYRPEIIVTEEYRWNEAKHKRKYEFLAEKNYEFYKRVGANTIWLNRANA